MGPGSPALQEQLLVPRRVSVLYTGSLGSGCFYHFFKVTSLFRGSSIFCKIAVKNEYFSRKTSFLENSQ